LIAPKSEILNATPQGDAHTLASYIETKYKLTPRFFGSLRWNQQFFSRVGDDGTHQVRWGEDVSRIEAGFGFRFTAHTQCKLQYSLQHSRQEDVGARRVGVVKLHATGKGVRVVAKCPVMPRPVDCGSTAVHNLLHGLDLALGAPRVRFRQMIEPLTARIPGAWGTPPS
jgi:hypothetical protein